MKKPIKKGDTFIVEFLHNDKDPKRPFCKIGRCICFIHNLDANYPQEGEVWRVSVLVVKTNYLVIDPIELIHTSFENKNIIQQKLKKLKRRLEGK